HALDLCKDLLVRLCGLDGNHYFCVLRHHFRMISDKLPDCLDDQIALMVLQLLKKVPNSDLLSGVPTPAERKSVFVIPAQRTPLRDSAEPSAAAEQWPASRSRWRLLWDPSQSPHGPPGATLPQRT